MTTKRQTPLERVQKRRGIKTTSPTTTSSNKLENQVKNYKTRLDNIGVDADDVTDNRNFLEKRLNLEKDQNVLFDIFEILDRPRNALFTGIANMQEGGSFGEGLLEGIKGETETSGGQLLRNIGIDSKGINGEDEAGLNPLSWGIDDILGFGLDMFADPTNYLLAPVKVANTADDVARIVDAAKAAGKSADKIEAITKAAEKGTKWALGSRQGWKPVDQVAMGLLGKAAKVPFKVADKTLELGLKGVDSINAKKIAKLIEANPGLTEAEAIAQLKINPNKLGVYKDLKKVAKNIVDSSSNIGGFVGRSREYESEQDLLRLVGEKRKNTIVEEATRIAKSMGMSTDEILKKGVNAIESNKNWDLIGQDIINKFKESKTIDLLTPEQTSKVKDTLDSFGIKSSIDKSGRKLHLDDTLDKLYVIQDALLDENIPIAFKDMKFGSKAYDDINELLKTDREFFNKSPELQKLYSKMENAVKEQALLSNDPVKGLIPGDIATTDYGKHSLTDNARKRVSEKEFQSRKAKYDAPIAQVNRMQEEERLAKLASEEAALDRNMKSIYKTEIDEAGNEVFALDSEGKYIIDDNKYQERLKKTQGIVNTLEKSIASNEQVLKYNRGESIDASLLNKKGQKAISQIDKKIASELEVEALSKEISEHLKEVKMLKNTTPDGIEALENLSKTYNEFSKRLTDLKNTMPKIVSKIKKGTLDELGGYLTANEQVKHTFEPLMTLRNKLREELTISKATFDDTFKKAIKEQLDSYKVGQELGEKLSKKTAAVKVNTSKIDLIRKTTTDAIVSSNKKLNFQKQALATLENEATKKAYRDKVLESIKKHTEQIELLKSQEGQDFFKVKFDEVFSDYVKASTQQNAGTKKFYDALANHLFDNDEYIKIYDGESIPVGFTKINGNNLIRKFDGYKAIMTDEGKELGDVLNKFKDKTLVIDSQFATALDVASKSNNSQLAPLFKVWDGMNNMFKKFSTLTGGFHLRNYTGNTINMALSGMNPVKIPEYLRKATDIWNNADNLVTKAAQGALSVDEAKQFEILKQFYQGGFADALKKGYGLEEVAEKIKSSTKNPINKLSNFSMNLNNKVDAQNRLALLMYANDNPNYLKRLGKDNAIDAVKYVLFDPNNLSETEKNLKRIIPFYTFTKQNLFFQASNLMKNTGRYKKLYRAFENAYDTLDEDAYYDYQKQGMQIPLPFQDDEGNQLFLKSNLPLSDLGEFLENPVQRLISSTSPLIKTPFERVTGVDTFTGQELHLDTLSGLTDKITDKLGINGGGARTTAQLAEHILKNFGLSNLSTNLVKKVQTALEYGAGDTSGQEVWAEIFRSVLQNTNEENVRNSGLYDELEAYQAEIKRLKNQGIDVPTIKEITASNKLKLNNLKNKRAKLK